MGLDASRTGCPWTWMLLRMLLAGTEPQRQCCSDIHVAGTVTCQCGTSSSSGNELCQHQHRIPLELHDPWGFPVGTRHVPALPEKGAVLLCCLAEAVAGCPTGTLGVEQGAWCWVWEQHPWNSPRGSLRCGQPDWAPGQLQACPAPCSTGPSSSAPTALPPPADKKGAARLCKMDLPALSGVAELSGLSQPTKPLINPPNDQFSFYRHQSNLGNVYSSIVPHTEAQGK